MCRYRSYHGGTNATLAVTGDQRRWGAEPMKMPGVVHFFDPYPYSFSFGEDEEAITKNKCVVHERLLCTIARQHGVLLCTIFICLCIRASFSFTPVSGFTIPILIFQSWLVEGCLNPSYEQKGGRRLRNMSWELEL